MSDIQQRWERINSPAISRVIDRAARRIAWHHPKVTEHEDLKQEARLACQEVPDLRSLLNAQSIEAGLLQYRLELALTRRMVRTQENHHNRMVDVEFIEDVGSNVAWAPVPPIAEDYTRDSVEVLLPAIWDESYTYGLPPSEHAPDPDMPRGASNPRTSNNLPAYIADIKIGWEKAPLTLKERRAVLLRFGFGWKVDEIAFNQGVANHSVISRRIESAVGKIVAQLNGGLYLDEEVAA